jgi:hypothetical protein
VGTPSVDGRSALNRRSYVVQHGQLTLAHLLCAEAHEPALLGRVGSRLRRSEQPSGERRGLLRCGLRGHDSPNGAQLVENLRTDCFSGVGLEALQGVVSASNGSRLGGLVADLRAAIDSFAVSNGPPGSARVIARPATNGARAMRDHSSSEKSLFVVMA